MADRSFFPLRRDLGFQLAALYFIFVGVVLVAAYFFAQSANQKLEKDISAADLALAKAVAQETHTTMSSALAAVEQLATDPAVIGDDPDGMLIVFATALSVRNDVNLIYRLNAQGNMDFHYPVGPESTIGDDFSFRPYFKQARMSHEAFISAGRISPTTNQPVATAVMPLWNGDEFLGLVGINLKLQYLSDTLTNIATTSYTDQQVEIAIIDQDRQIIGHSKPSLLLQDASTLFPQAAASVLAGQTGNFVTRDHKGQEQIYSYTPIGETQWGVVVNRPTASAFAILKTFQQGTFIVVAIFLTSGLIFWRILSRRVIHPLEQLATLSQEAWSEQHTSGDVSASLATFTHRTDQMGTLTRSLQRMQQAVEARLNELATLLKTSAAVVSTLDSETVLLRILEQVEALLGVDMSAIFVLDEESNLFRVAASRYLPNWYAQTVMISPQDPNSLAMRAIRTGEPIQVSDTETDPTYTHNRPRARLAGYRSLMAIKLPVQHTPAAVLLVCRKEPYTFSEREIRLLTSFANHATMAIENAALYASSDLHLQEQTRRLEALIQSMHDGLVLEDSEGYVLYANRRIQDLIGLPLDTIYQKPIRLLIEGLVAQAGHSKTAEVAISKALIGQGIRHAEFDQIRTPGIRHLHVTLFDVRDDHQVLIGRGWIFEDSTQRYLTERMRSILIATVSHELRTPLAAIKGYASTLLEEDVVWDAQSQREFLTIISQETDRLNTLVQDLMDMSRIEAGSLIIKRVRCHLPKLIDLATQHAAPDINHRVRVDLPADLPAIYVDPQRIEAVLRNLIENAAKYSPADTPIRVIVALNGSQLAVQVVDEGPGISPEQGEQVFESFYRGDNNLVIQTGGTGLGLAIARSFVQVHGGRIWLERGEKGTSIAFSIPIQLDSVQVQL